MAKVRGQGRGWDQSSGSRVGEASIKGVRVRVKVGGRSRSMRSREGVMVGGLGVGVREAVGFSGGKV